MVSVFYLLLTTYLALSLCTPNTVLGEEERYRPYGKLTAQMYLNKWSALNSRYVECNVAACFYYSEKRFLLLKCCMNNLVSAYQDIGLKQPNACHLAKVSSIEDHQELRWDKDLVNFVSGRKALITMVRIRTHHIVFIKQTTTVTLKHLQHISLARVYCSKIKFLFLNELAFSNGGLKKEPVKCLETKLFKSEVKMRGKYFYLEEK